MHPRRFAVEKCSLHRCALLFRAINTLYLSAPCGEKLNFDHRALDRDLGGKGVEERGGEGREGGIKISTPVNFLRQ